MGYLETNFRIFIYFDLACVPRDSGGTVGVLLKPNRWLSSQDLAKHGAFNSQHNTRIKVNEKDTNKKDNCINTDIDIIETRNRMRACKRLINYKE